MLRHAARPAIVSLLLLLLVVTLASTVGCGPNKRSDRRPSDGYVPPEPEPSQHDAPPRHHRY